MAKRRPGKKCGRRDKKVPGVRPKNCEAERDALGRRRWVERRRIERLKAKRTPLTPSGHHPAAVGAPEMAKRIREERGLSLQAGAELAEMTPIGLAKFEAGKGGGMSETVGFVCRGYGVELSSFYRRIEREGRLRRGHGG